VAAVAIAVVGQDPFDRHALRGEPGDGRSKNATQFMAFSVPANAE
jgi:hypothetical protein